MIARTKLLALLATPCICMALPLLARADSASEMVLEAWSNSSEACTPFFIEPKAARVAPLTQEQSTFGMQSTDGTVTWRTRGTETNKIYEVGVFCGNDFIEEEVAARFFNLGSRLMLPKEKWL